MFEPIIVAALAAGATAWLMHALALNTGLHAVAGALCFAALYLMLSHIGSVAGYVFLRKKLHAWRHRNASTLPERSEEHTSELQSLMRNSYAVFCLKKKKNITSKRTEKIHIIV